MKDAFLLMVFLLSCNEISAQSNNTKFKTKPKNIIFILADDHRFDAMGFMNTIAGLKTPNLDKLAKEGAHVKNACVSTALCSPSRASILTGQYAHTHKVVDNFAPLPNQLKFFPQYLQQAGYQTAFLGKWHMGNTDDAPQKGFDYWLSFKGQGEYYHPTFNINGKQVKHTDSTHITDLLTNYALDWLNTVKKDKPFFIYLSHKAVHASFEPTQRHKDIYKNQSINYPASMYLTATDSSKNWGGEKDKLTQSIFGKANIIDMPKWVKNQRYSWHGVDYLYHGKIGFNDFYHQYFETLLGVDESVGKLLEWLKINGLDENTMVVYMGDNGFSFGERGLIDKRHMYEESMRVPLLIRCPSIIQPKTEVEQVIQNIDIAPTLLAYANQATPSQMQGNSFLNILKKQSSVWKDKAFYEYYWETDFPQTPTCFGVRTERYKYIYYHGVWDTNELYDLQTDPMEINNLIRSKEHQEIAHQLRDQVFDWLEATGGMQIPLNRIIQKRFDHQNRGNY